MRFKVGDKSQGVEIVSINDNQYNMICKCERMFSRGFTMLTLPGSCRTCMETQAQGMKAVGVTSIRPYTDRELEMIKEFEGAKND